MTQELDAADRNAMPDSEYAFPRVRKEPLNDASHVRNAIARFDQVEDVSDDEGREAFERIRRAANRFGVELSESRWQDLGKPTGNGKQAGSSKPTGSGKPAGTRSSSAKGRSNMTKYELQRDLNR